MCSTISDFDLGSQQLIRQVRRFAISGLLATLLHTVVAVGLIRLLGMSEPPANGLAFAIATVFSYTINTLWSFSSALQSRNLIRFVCVSVVGGVLAMAMAAVAAAYGLHYLAGIGMVVMVVPPVTFVLHHFWTYR